MKDLEKAKKQKIKVRKTDKAATIKGSLYSIEFHDDFKNLGTSYTYKMAGSDADIIEYMVPPSFLPLTYLISLSLYIIRCISQPF